MKQVEHDQRSRLPKGIASKNPTPMRLSDGERSELEALAAKESRSISSMARLVYLRGIAAIQAD
ncbi:MULTISPECIES: hypothetical protein [Yersinia]|uniref:Ribbon-helix-helix protein CopG domain-containing protein n=1 Tax=Yersinia thracica TaxID=2890319 RepID=A0A0T9QF23_9GAMM|nr:MULTISPECIES: hypothetical protein [Yersinia]EKN3458369.1 hypothetical protein [Yersinia enterocolitica]EKN3970541.1 hypothetical protein [Yersinia enterocolitica]EKN4802693.1 hypothetical protein [Yersinia enterocolitica]EKN4845874.1 hypothetical protein [Yersinia enterocolitica]EKN4862605.1 hypothetical protein [Yersinia enterocolitica]